MKIIKKNLKAFQDLGSSWELEETIFGLLNEYVSILYGSQKKDVNEVCYQRFQKKYEKQDKIIDLLPLPPCQSVLMLHAKRANFVAKILKCSFEAQLQILDIGMHGWDVNGKIIWLQK